MAENSIIEHLYQDEEAKKISFVSFNKKYKEARINILFSNHNEMYTKEFKEEYRGMGTYPVNKDDADMLRFWGKKHNFHLNKDGTFENHRKSN